MHRDRHNLKCALVGFLLAAIAGFASSAELDFSNLVDGCPPAATRAAPQE